MNVAPAKYAQIRNRLRAQIADGTLKPGDPLPSEADLVRTDHVARGTARNALLDLEQAGLVTPGRPGPRRVAHHKPLTIHVTRTADTASPGEQPTDGADAWVGDMHTAGYQPTQHIEVVTVHASPPVARRLGVPGGEVVTSRRLVRGTGGQPHNLITFWFPRDIAQGTPLADPASITEGSVAWLERTHGPLTHRVRISSRMPGPAETALHVPGGIPLVVVWRTSRNETRPVMCSMAVYPADRAELELVL